MAGIDVDTRSLAPRFLLSVEGTPLKEDLLRHVNSIVYEESEELASKIEIELSDPNFKLVDHKAFAEGNRLDLWLGYAGRKMHFQNRCTIVRPVPRFPDGGMPTLNPVAHDASRSLMLDSPKGLRFKQVRDDDTIRKLCSRVGIRDGGIRKAGTPRTRFLKRGDSPWDLIQKISKRWGYSFAIRFNPAKNAFEAFWGPPERIEAQDRKFTFVYGTGEEDATLLRFEPDISIVDQPTEVEVVYVDPVKRRSRRLSVNVGAATAENARFVGTTGVRPMKRSLSNGPNVRLTVFGQSTNLVVDRPFESAKEAKRFASAWYYRRAREFANANATVLGEGALRRGQIHKFVVPSNRFTGDWLITSLRQRMTSSGMWLSELSLSKVVLGAKVSAGKTAGVTQTESEQ